MRGKKQKTERVIPGVGLSFGITITMLGLIVVIPLWFTDYLLGADVFS